MPRAIKTPEPVTIETSDEVKVLPGPKHHAQVFGLATPDEVACESCGAFSPSNEIKCSNCGVRWDTQDQTHRQNIARRQEIAVGEEAQRQQVMKSREIDPNLATSVTDALASAIRDALQIRDRAAAEVEASKDRLEKAQAALFANDCAETRDDFQRAQLQAMAAPGNLALAEAALKQLAALQPMAEECDALRVAGSTPEGFRKELALRMQIARKHLDSAMAEFAAAFELQKEHENAGRMATAKRTKLNEKVQSIRRSFDLRPRLPHGYGRFASWDDVSHAAARAIIDAIEKSTLGNALASDLRSRIR
ncbi:MAG TPA: hypothetical protein VHP33_33415 [Polyangiaceae bacterium]|nr:hypothetical protein [Polyangiaceae bacterium]